MNTQGPTRIRIDEMRCALCRFHSRYMMVSGRNPLYRHYCEHPASKAIEAGILSRNLPRLEQSEGRFIGHNDLTPSWCPVTSMPSPINESDRNPIDLREDGQP